MTRTNIKDLVGQILARVAGTPIGAAVEPARLAEDLGLDSIALVSLQVEIEDETGLRFDPMANDLAEVFRTVDSLVTYLEGRLDA